jgi:hypothetical protein
MFMVVHLSHTETARPVSSRQRHAANLDKSGPTSMGNVHIAPASIDLSKAEMDLLYPFGEPRRGFGAIRASGLRTRLAR